MFNNKSILITGGTGSFGKEFALKVLKKFKPKKLIIFSRDELKQSLMEKDETFSKYKKILRFFIGDVRDRDRLKLAVKNIDYVIHAAALKHVNVAEYNPFEFIKTNIMGTQNLIDVCIENKVKKIIALSTDKASSAINLYGATKLASDKLVVASNSYSGPKTQLSVVRYGNVFGSRGSVAEIFLDNLRKKKVLKLTHPKMTRFHITLPQSVDFVLKCFKFMNGGEIFVPKIPSFRTIELIKAIYNNKKPKIIGVRPGEKIHEDMISSSDALNTLEYRDYFCIYNELSSFKSKLHKKKNFPRKCPEDFTYTSENNKYFLDVKDLKKLFETYSKNH